MSLQQNSVPWELPQQWSARKLDWLSPWSVATPTLSDYSAAWWRVWVIGSAPSFILGYFYTAGDICPVSILNMVHIFVLLQHAPVFSEHPCSQSHQPAISKGSRLAHTAHWKTQLWAAAWGKGHFYNTVPSITSPFLFSSWVQTSPMCTSSVPEVIAFCHCIAEISTSYPSIRLPPNLLPSGA